HDHGADDEVVQPGPGRAPGLRHLRRAEAVAPMPLRLRTAAFLAFALVASCGNNAPPATGCINRPGQPPCLDGGPPDFGTLPAATNVFQGSVPLRPLDSGRYLIQVQAATTDGPSSTATRRVRVNSGPLINIVAPTEGQPTRDRLAYQFTVAISDVLQGFTVS